MKFDCGETEEEKNERLSKWHKKFCWLKMKVGDHDCRWLEFVWRRGEYHLYGSLLGGFYTWQYKPISEDNEHEDGQHTQGE